MCVILVILPLVFYRDIKRLEVQATTTFCASSRMHNIDFSLYIRANGACLDMLLCIIYIFQTTCTSSTTTTMWPIQIFNLLALQCSGEIVVVKLYPYTDQHTLWVAGIKKNRKIPQSTCPPLRV